MMIVMVTVMAMVMVYGDGGDEVPVIAMNGEMTELLCTGSFQRKITKTA